MNDPVRLRDEAESTVELLLLAAGTAYRSSDTARAKTLAALGLAGSAAVSAGAVSVAASSVGKASWAGKWLLLSGVGAAVAGPIGYIAWERSHAHTAPAAVVLAPAVAARPTEAPAVASLEPVPTAKNEVVPSPTPPSIKLEPRTTATSALAAELGALDAARSRLSAGDASGALAKLDDYARAYPRGRLVLEAEVLRIDALSRAGQKDQAKKRAESFLRRHPNSVLATRVRGYLE
jgi:hypothetical protein